MDKGYLSWLLYGITALVCCLHFHSAFGDDQTTFCDVGLTGRITRGVVRSYNYPFQYRHNLTCTYRIYVNNEQGSTKKICFTFHRFNLESSTPFCSYDYLKFENTKYCGVGWWQYGSINENPISNVWTGNFCWTVKEEHFDIYFNSDNNLNDKGFYATYVIYDTVVDSSTPQEAPVGTAPCSDKQWTCFNRHCIGKDLLCNGEDNCGDSSDESYTHARCGEQSVIACDFEAQSGISDGYCGFTHEGWFRTNEPLLPYGPKGDHTNTTHGYYVYSDVNQSAAYLLSPELTLPRNRTFCLQFWYYVYGRPANAALRVYVSREQAYSRPEWTRTSVPEDQWLMGEISFTTNQPLQAIFAADLDNSFSGVALDDISLLEGPCMGNDVACNFETGTCSWANSHLIKHTHGELHGDLNWRIHSRLIASVGPFWDHSSRDGGGYYLYLNYTTDKSKDNRALLVSHPISSFGHEQRCLRFWYFMSGMDKDCGTLKVKIHRADDVLSEAVWSQHGDVRNAWKEASINLLHEDKPYQIVLEGIVSEGSRGELAIDELILMDGLCSEINGGACQPGQYLCQSGKCINSTLKCDGTPHCEDGSDEDWRAGCPSPAPTPDGGHGESTCPPTHYKCHEDGKCIPSGWVCDSFKDCTDDSDENHLADCPEGASALPTSEERPVESCASGEYLCHDHRCIRDNLRCNGAHDCTDGSDEGAVANCTGSVPPVLECPSTEFLCDGDLTCIAEDKMCDGHEDCADKSDEQSCPSKVQDPSNIGTGVLIGICMSVLVVIIIVVVVFIMFRRRQKQKTRSRRRHIPPRIDSGISTISRYTEDTTVERHISMLESMRDPMRQVRQPPPYTEEGENRAYTPERAGLPASISRDSGRGSTDALPPDEPPPPYDAVIKDPAAPGQQERRDNAQNSAALGSRPGTSSGSRHGSQENIVDGRDSRRGQPPGVLNTVLPSLGQPNPYQRGPDGRPPALPPLPQDRPPISPSGSRTLPHQRIRLGTTALQRPRNYINQSGSPNQVPHSNTMGHPTLLRNYLNQLQPGANNSYLSDTDGDTNSVTDHIYETLNLPDSRPNTPRSLPASTAINAAPGLSTFTTADTRPHGQHPLVSPPINRADHITSNCLSPAVNSRPLSYTPGSYPQLDRPPASQPPRNTAPRSQNPHIQNISAYPRNYTPHVKQIPSSEPPIRHKFSPYPYSQNNNMASFSSPSSRPTNIAPPSANRKNSGPNLRPNNSALSPGSRVNSNNLPLTSPPNRPQHKPSSQEDPLHGRTISQRSFDRVSNCRTPDSQSQLLPGSNNSSFDNSSPLTGSVTNGNTDQNQNHPRQDSNSSNHSVVFSNLDDALLPTNV